MPVKPKTSTASTAAVTGPQETWQQREERLHREQQVQQQLDAIRAEARRPTAWQFQNPSGGHNRFPTDPPRGYTAPNTYFGPDYRDWSRMSGPASLSQLPANYYTPPPVIFSNVPVAPNMYYGAANQSWSNIRVGDGVPSALGGWNWVPGN